MYAMAWHVSRGLGMPVVAFLASCLGGALGLRCLVRSLWAVRPWRTGRLVLSAAAIGCGAWVTHTIGMMDFSVDGTQVGYDPLILFAALGVGIVMIGTGTFIVGHRGITGPALFTGGTLTGLGIASMHYLSMAGVRLDGRLEYDTLVVAASVVITVVAATGALWVAGQQRGPGWDAGAVLAMGLAGVGMHHVGMAAVHVRLFDAAAESSGGSPVKTLAVLLIGPVVFLALLTALALTAPRSARAARAMGTEPVTPHRITLLPTQRSGRTEASHGRSRAGQNR